MYTVSGNVLSRPQRDSPNGMHRKESMEYYGISGNPARSRPSPVRGQSPQDVTGPPITAFPNQPQRRGTPGGVRRTSADRRGNSPATNPLHVNQHGGGEDDWVCGHCHKTNQRRFDNSSCHHCHRPRVNWAYGSSGNTPTSRMTGTPERRNTTQEEPKPPPQETDAELDRTLSQLIAQHVTETPLPDAADESKPIIKVMQMIEKAFWAYIENYASSPAHPKAYKFDKGLLKEFTVEVLKKMPKLCELWAKAPTGGLDCDKDEVNKKKVAEHFHRTLCEYKMGEPVAGAVLVTQDLKKILLVKNGILGSGWTLPKGKVQEIDTNSQDPCASAAIRHVFAQTNISIASRLSKAKKVIITVDRYTVRQPQTLFILPIDEREIPKDKEAAWKPLSSLPILETVATKQTPLNKKAPPEYENVVVFFKKLVAPLSQMAQNVDAGRAPEGPAVELDNTPLAVLDYAAQREKMIATQNFESRWKYISKPLPAPTIDAFFISRRDAVKTKLFAELSKVNVIKPITA